MSDRICSIDGCSKPMYARGWCGMHYQRQRTTGEIGEAAPRFMQNSTDEERFWAKVDRRVDDECWAWTAGTFTNGYGVIRREEGTNVAHRFAYELLVGPIPDGLHLDHLCHTEAVQRGECAGGDVCAHRRCVNPAHLEPVTLQENIGRGSSAQKTECKRGHDLTDPANLKPNSRGARQCRECANISRRDRYARLGR